MRMLVEVCNTLEPIPDERYVFVKLTYTPQTPADYEPPYFEPAGHRAVGCFAHRPFSIGAGRVATKHHTVELGVRSVLDAVEDDDEDEQQRERGDDHAPESPAAALRKPYADDQSLRASTLDSRDDSFSTAGQESVRGGKRRREPDRLPTHAEEEEEIEQRNQDVGKTKEIEQRKRKEDDGGEVEQREQDGGKGRENGRGRRRGENDRDGRLVARPSPSDPGKPGKQFTPGASRVDKDALREESQAGAIASQPGSAATTSSGRAIAAPPQRPENDAFPETQDSAVQGTARKKTSFVHQPLRQRAKSESGGTSEWIAPPSGKAKKKTKR